MEEIFYRFIQPYFSIEDYIIYFEWDRISRSYRYVVTRNGNKNKFISFYLRESKSISEFELVVIYTSVGEFNFHNTQKILFLLGYDNLERFNQFYQELIEELNEKTVKDSPFDFFIPFFMVDRGKQE
ncbi:hypothetical protein [Maribellus sp. YY47]|uniref:hypothetical protein n=1 Tax=Maribellus sp. YY47 TaxID=2929486 RepID=UPI002000C085|nr:hypothetical protein [Maribellus sp. YY47]MCK3684247.1 hypothetical protein [Maribellus sp. YY47]